MHDIPGSINYKGYDPLLLQTFLLVIHVSMRFLPLLTVSFGRFKTIQTLTFLDLCAIINIVILKKYLKLIAENYSMQSEGKSKVLVFNIRKTDYIFDHIPSVSE